MQPTPERSFAGRSGPQELILLLAGAAVASALLIAAFRGRHQDFGELALGKSTTSVYAELDGHPIHCADVENAAGCLEGHAARGDKPVVLWLGNSQVHAVNQWAPGQENAPPILFRRLQDEGRDLLTFSQPNANLQEHLVLFAWLKSRLPIEDLLLPVVFDDLRETGIRPTLIPALDDPPTRTLLLRHAVGRRILEQQGETPEGDLAALDQTVQERSERALNGWLEEHSELWALRPQVRGTLFSNLYRLRNTALGIDAQSRRRLIPGRRDLNLAAARAILEEARAADIRVLVYVVPLRSDVRTPYVPEEYRDFKQQIERIARERGASFANLEDLVPAALWGAKGATGVGDGEELDFMHFQAGGHALLASALGRDLDALFDGELRRATLDLPAERDR